jgi:hypothetical protein
LFALANEQIRNLLACLPCRLFGETSAATNY